MRTRVLFTLLTLFSLTNFPFAQDGYFSNWFARVDKSKEEQPHWVTPLATTTPRLEEEYRYDQTWQENAKGVTTDSFDGGKGVELIPFEKVEVIFNLPPYIEHNNPKVKDGWGDVAFLIKYRLLSANEKSGNYILTAFLGWSLPTGQFANGALHPVITPPSPTARGSATSICRAQSGLDFLPPTPALWDGTSLGTTLFNTACCANSGPRSSSIQSSSRMERMTAKNRILSLRGWSWDDSVWWVGSALLLAADTRLPPPSFTARITTQFSPCASPSKRQKGLADEREAKSNC